MRPVERKERSIDLKMIFWYNILFVGFLSPDYLLVTQRPKHFQFRTPFLTHGLMIFHKMSPRTHQNHV